MTDILTSENVAKAIYNWSGNWVAWEAAPILIKQKCRFQADAAIKVLQVEKIS